MSRYKISFLEKIKNAIRYGIDSWKEDTRYNRTLDKIHFNQKTCLHQWNIDDSYSANVNSSGETVYVWRCFRCKLFEWSKDEPDIRYFYDHPYIGSK